MTGADARPEAINFKKVDRFIVHMSCLKINAIVSPHPMSEVAPSAPLVVSREAWYRRPLLTGVY